MSDELSEEDYQAQLNAQIEAGKCTFFIKRHRRFCRKTVIKSISSNNETCHDHLPETLAAIREATFKKREELAQMDSSESRARRPRISSSQKRMVNPLGKLYQIPAQAPVWDRVYNEACKPLVVDVGCARGKLLQQMAEKDPCTFNYCGIEIRPALVEAAIKEAQKNKTNGRLHFLSCNINVSLESLFSASRNSQLNTPPLVLICFQFPDPWKRAKHKRRRVVNPELVDALSRVVTVGGLVYISSDVEELAVQMRHFLHEDERFALYEPPTSSECPQIQSLSSFVFSSYLSSLDTSQRPPCSPSTPVTPAQNDSCSTAATTTSDLSAGVAAGENVQGENLPECLAELDIFYDDSDADQDDGEEGALEQESIPSSDFDGYVSSSGIYDSKGWLVQSPLPVPSEREHVSCFASHAREAPTVPPYVLALVFSLNSPNQSFAGRDRHHDQFQCRSVK